MFFQKLQKILKAPFLASLGVMSSVLAPPVHAHCPLCVGALGAAAASATYFGLDGSVVGAFAGAMGASTGVWIARKIKRKYIPGQNALIILGSYISMVLALFAIDTGIVYIPIFLAGTPGALLNKAYFVSKGLLGSFIGAPIAYFSWILHEKIKTVRGRVLFPFQGTAFTIIATIVAALPLQLYFG